MQARLRRFPTRPLHPCRAAHPQPLHIRLLIAPWALLLPPGCPLRLAMLQQRVRPQLHLLLSALRRPLQSAHWACLAHRQPTLTTQWLACPPVRAHRGARYRQQAAQPRQAQLCWATLLPALPKQLQSFTLPPVHHRAPQDHQARRSSHRLRLRQSLASCCVCPP